MMELSVSSNLSADVAIDDLDLTWNNESTTASTLACVSSAEFVYQVSLGKGQPDTNLNTKSWYHYIK